ncbi:MAG: hypothetical protein K2X27_15550 [Candidatus Obscuribacterales bacterium]|nr:hypothetical protein [Candidatus Obscuribacterales bacterium]
MKAKTDIEACNLLDNLVIASPCSIPWDAMKGDERKRLCGGCSRFVHNISDMTRSEAELFLQENGTSQCMIFYRRFDGTIMTDDCPRALRKLRNACKTAYRVAAGLLAVLFTLPAASAQQAKSNSKPLHRNQFGLQFDYEGKVPAAPPGFYYTSNPAGGGMVLRPIAESPDSPSNSKPGNTKKVKPESQQTPMIPMPPGLPAPLPIESLPKAKKGNDCSPSTLIIKHKNPTLKSPTASLQEFTYPEKNNPNLSTVAHEYYLNGKVALSEGRKVEAHAIFSKALEAFDQQKLGDGKFRQEIQRAIDSTK